MREKCGYKRCSKKYSTKSRKICKICRIVQIFDGTTLSGLDTSSSRPYDLDRNEWETRLRCLIY
jgi:hypothetical protein